MFCNKCGKEINEDSIFCNYCGNKLKTKETRQENAKPNLKEEIKEAWRSGPERAEKERIEKEQREYLKQLKETKEEVQKNLKPKDGKYHVVLIKSKARYLTGYKICDNQYAIELEDILEMIQGKGYEIIDVKMIGIEEGSAYGTTRVETLVMYK